MRQRKLTFRPQLAKVRTHHPTPQHSAAESRRSPALLRALDAFERLRPQPDSTGTAVAAEAVPEMRRGGDRPPFASPPHEMPSFPEPHAGNPRRSLKRGDARRKQEARDEASRLAYLDRCREKGIPEDAIPPHVPMSVYRMVQSIMGDRTGRKTVGWMELTARRMSGYPLALLRQGFGGEPNLRDERTRTIIATALMMMHLAVRVRRKGRWSRMVSGYGIECLRAVVHRAQWREKKLGRSAFGGGGRKTAEHRARAYTARWSTRTVKHGARPTSWKPVLQWLRDCGVLYAQQLPASCVKAWEKTTGHTPRVRNRYWIACVSWPDLARRAAVRGGRLARMSDTLLGMLQEEFAALNGQGFEMLAALRQALDPPPEASA